MPQPVKTVADFLVDSGTAAESDVIVVARPDGRWLFGETDGNDVWTRNISGTDHLAGTWRQHSGGTTEQQVGAAALSSGFEAIAWAEGSAGSRDIYAEVRSSSGAVISLRFLVNDTATAGDQLRPEVVALGPDRFAVSWIDLNTGRIVYRVFDVGGNGISGALNASNSLVDQDWRHDWTALANGDAVLSYRKSEGGSGPAFVIVNRDAGIVVPETVIPDGAGSVATAALANGGFVAVTTGKTATIYDSAGNLQASATGILSIGDYVQVTGLHDGRFMVVAAKSDGDILARVFFADGTADGAEFQVNSIATAHGFSTRPSIATLADGRVVVGWTTIEEGDQDTKAAIFDPRETGLSRSATSFADEWIGTGFDDLVYLGDGNDVIFTGNGLDFIYGEAGDDLLRGEAGNDRIYGGDGNDGVLGGLGADLIYGGNGNDTLSGQEDGDTWIGGGAGNDTLNGNAGNDRLDGGTGVDTLNGDADADYITGGDGDDTINGGTGNDSWLGGDAGNDTIYGGDGNDTLSGGLGNDTLFGGADADYITGGDGNDPIVGGDGNDSWLGGDAGDDGIFGGSGNDRLDGGAGNDTLFGDTEIDYITGGTGNDNIYGGDGNDSWLGGDGGDDTIFGDAGNDRIDGGAGNDTLYGGNEIDYITGGNDNDFIAGGDGNDSWLGGDAGHDTIFGDAGNDRIDGGAGNDTLYGGAGSDIITGGTGNDFFGFDSFNEGIDSIVGWTAGQDKIRIDASNFGGGLVAGGLNANQLVVGPAPGQTQPFGQFLFNTTTGVLFWDQDGTGGGFVATQIATLNAALGVPITTLSTSDFDIIA